MKKSILTLLLVFVLVIICACSNGDVSIMEDESFYSDYYVENEKVYINCTLTVCSSKDQTVSFVGEFKSDTEIGLLTEETLKTTSFDIKKGKQIIDVTFMGNFGGTNKKASRNLPYISVLHKNDKGQGDDSVLLTN